MLAIHSILLLLVVSLCSARSGSNRECAQDVVDFATKVEKSSVVVYGKTMAKIMNNGSDSVFYVFFQVDCILKGPATLRQINILNAGRVEGKQYCQEFPAGHGYSIAFLEPSPLNETDHKTFIPADFVEIIDDGNTTEHLLARTCQLHRLVPLHSSALVAEICPAVATDPQCQQNINTASNEGGRILLNATIVGHPDLVNNLTKTILNLPMDQGHLSHPIASPEQEIDAIRSKSAIIQTDQDLPSGAQSTTFSVLLVLLAALLSA